VFRVWGLLYIYCPLGLYQYNKSPFVTWYHSSRFLESRSPPKSPLAAPGSVDLLPGAASPSTPNPFCPPSRQVIVAAAASFSRGRRPLRPHASARVYRAEPVRRGHRLLRPASAAAGAVRLVRPPRRAALPSAAVAAPSPLPVVKPAARCSRSSPRWLSACSPRTPAGPPLPPDCTHIYLLSAFAWIFICCCAATHFLLHERYLSSILDSLCVLLLSVCVCSCVALFCSAHI